MKDRCAAKAKRLSAPTTSAKTNTLDNKERTIKNSQSTLKNTNQFTLVCPSCKHSLDTTEPVVRLEACGHLLHQRCFNVLLQYKQKRKRLSKRMDKNGKMLIACVYPNCDALSNIHTCEPFNFYV